MRIPQSPPALSQILGKITTERFLELIETAKITDHAGRYLHWDELRHKTLPENHTPEEWWAGLRFARRSAAQKLPFQDTHDKPFFYTEPPELKALIRYADMNAAGTLETSRHGLSTEDGHRYMRRSLAEEPFASSLIEGAVTTREIAKKMIFENRPPRTRDERMVLNNFNGMEFIKSIQSEALSVSYILELHRILMKDTLDDPTGAGRLRVKEDKIAVVDDSSGEILHLPPDANLLRERLNNLCEFANKPDDDMSYFHPLLKAMTLHFMLAYEHPFIDGNGRTARALFYWMLLKAGYWLMEYTSISSIIAASPGSYYKAFLFSETDEGDLTYFFLHQARATRQALERMHFYADEKRREFEKFNKIINEQKLKNPLNERQTILIQDFVLGREKSVEISDYRKRYLVSYITARNDLEDMVMRGLLRKMKKGRFSVYYPESTLSKKFLLI